MKTYSGRDVWPREDAEWPTPEGVSRDVGPSLEDIAVGLGRMVRWAGQMRGEFYTVLCHSFVCEKLGAEFHPDDGALRRWLLFHDGHEAVLADRARTWKHEAIKRDEADIDRRIALEFNLPTLADDDRLLLKKIDNAVLAAEAHALNHCDAEAVWPRGLWGALEERAHELTVGHLQVGNPIRYLAPENSIRAFQRVLGGIPA